MNVSQVGRSLTVPGAFSLLREGGTTRIRLEADWRVLGLNVVATSLGVGSFSSITWLALLADVLFRGIGGHRDVIYDAVQFVVVTTLAFSFTVGSSAWIHRRASRRAYANLDELVGTFAAILAFADEHAVRTVPPSRVAEEESEAEPLGTSAQRARRA